MFRLSSLAPDVLACLFRGGAGTPEHSLLISNVSSSAAYTSVLDSPIQVSAIEIVGVDAECLAKVSWNVSIKTGKVYVCVCICRCTCAHVLWKGNECLKLLLQFSLFVST